MNDDDYIVKLLEAIDELRAENARLREALQALYDVQNGCPLPKYQAEYDVAMVKANEALQGVKDET